MEIHVCECIGKKNFSFTKVFQKVVTEESSKVFPIQSETCKKCRAWIEYDYSRRTLEADQITTAVQWNSILSKIRVDNPNIFLSLQERPF